MVKWCLNGGYEFDLIRVGVMKREVGKERWEKGEIEEKNVSESGRGRGRKIRRKKGEK